MFEIPTCLLHLEASKRLIRHLQIIPKALKMIPRGLIEKHKQDRKESTNSEKPRMSITTGTGLAESHTKVVPKRPMSKNVPVLL